MFKTFMPLVNIDEDFDGVFDRLHDQLMNSLSQKSGFIKLIGDSSYPKCNVRVDGNDVVFDIAIPYHRSEDVKVSIEDNVLTISGQSAAPKADEVFLLREIPQRSFARSWRLPAVPSRVLSESDIAADYKDGLLTIRVKELIPPKVEKKRIDIKLSK